MAYPSVIFTSHRLGIFYLLLCLKKSLNVLCGIDFFWKIQQMTPTHYSFRIIDEIVVRLRFLLFFWNCYLKRYHIFCLIFVVFTNIKVSRRVSFFAFFLKTSVTDRDTLFLKCFQRYRLFATLPINFDIISLKNQCAAVTPIYNLASRVKKHSN